MQSPQASIVTPAPRPAPINHSRSTDPTTTAQPSSVAQAPTITHPTASTSGPPSRRLCCTVHVPNSRGLLVTIMHVNDFDDNYLPLARIDDDMLLCLYTAAANASDVLTPPKNYKDIHGRPEEEEWRATCIEVKFKDKVVNNTFDLVKRPNNELVCKTMWGLFYQYARQQRHPRTTQSALGTSRLQSTTWSSFCQDLHGKC
eukprot:6212527-Pleurochrysis_carterae.AAC.1